MYFERKGNFEKCRKDTWFICASTMTISMRYYLSITNSFQHQTPIHFIYKSVHGTTSKIYLNLWHELPWACYESNNAINYQQNYESRDTWRARVMGFQLLAIKKVCIIGILPGYIVDLLSGCAQNITDYCKYQRHCYKICAFLYYIKVLVKSEQTPFASIASAFWSAI